YVYVDTDYKGYEHAMKLAIKDPEPAQNRREVLGREYRQAKISFASASATLDNVYDTLREGKGVDIHKVKKAVSPLIESVFRNAEAVAALVRLKESGNYRYQHGLSMAVWAAILGKHIGLHKQELEKLVLGCTMCDVGMTQLPADLLEHSGDLDAKQKKIVRAHPTIGAEILASAQDVDAEVLAIIELHHERIDGSGYPMGVEGFAVPLLARIAGLVDTYDAMITPRPYAEARTSHGAIQELLDLKGSKFQDSLVEQFVQAIGLFPTGSLVELNSGDVGIVLSQNSTRRLKPEVLLILHKAKGPLSERRIIDLAKQDVDDTHPELWISRELPEGSYGISSDEFFI
ncbi:MAG: HD domain-containing protein, partial [Halioglobus sp.]|nr:HD domain-containing protein [Halioglobus sp.]